MTILEGAMIAALSFCITVFVLMVIDWIRGGNYIRHD